MTNAYIDPFQYKAAPTGQEIASLIGNLLKVASAGCAAGAISLPLASATTVALNVGDNIYIFDGSNTEIVTLATVPNPNPGVTALAISPTQFAHTGSAVVCTDGASGSLSQTIINASSELEVICKQPLLQATYTETYALQTMQCSIDNIGTLNIRTTKLPITALTSALLTTDVISGQAIALAKVKFKGQIISVLGVGGNVFNAGGSLSQSTEGDIDVTFTAGLQYAALPYKIKQACILLTSDLLSDRLNPSGAAIMSIGMMHIQQRLKDEKKSMFYTRAEENLKEFTVKVY